MAARDRRELSLISSSSAAAAGDDSGELRRGPWTAEEDAVLVSYVGAHGEGRWNALARGAGLRRTGKSCRLRWLNYLRPDLRRGNITAREQLLILELHARWGSRWSKIARHLPGRTDNEIKNYWRTRVQKHARQLSCGVDSQRFKDLVRHIWMPRLIERIAGGGADGGGGIDDACCLAAPPPPTQQQKLLTADDAELSCCTTAAVSSSSGVSTDSMQQQHPLAAAVSPPPQQPAAMASAAYYGVGVGVENSSSTATASMSSSMWDTNTTTTLCQPLLSTAQLAEGGGTCGSMISWSDESLLVPDAAGLSAGMLLGFPDLCDDTDTMWADDLWYTQIIMGL